jgi:hypothetical protein
VYIGKGWNVPNIIRSVRVLGKIILLSKCCRVSSKNSLKWLTFVSRFLFMWPHESSILDTHCRGEVTLPALHALLTDCSFTYCLNMLQCWQMSVASKLSAPLHWWKGSKRESSLTAQQLSTATCSFCMTSSNTTFKKNMKILSYS